MQCLSIIGHIMVITVAKSVKIGIPANATHGVQSDVASAGLFEKAADLSVVLRRHNVKIGKIAAEIFCGACKEQTKCKQ